MYGSFRPDQDTSVIEAQYRIQNRQREIAQMSVADQVRPRRRALRPFAVILALLTGAR